VTITADDGSGPGVAKIEYRTATGAAWTTYTTPVSVSNEGTTTVEYQATDQAGNVSDIGSRVVKIDTATPSLNPSVAGTTGSNGWYVGSSAPKVTPNAIDPGSDIALIEYQIGASPSDTGWLTYTSGIDVPESSGYVVNFRATDKAGNRSAAQSITVKYDKTLPSVSADLIKATPDGVNGWYKTQPSVTLNASDAGSGLASVQYQINGTAGAWLSYSAPIAVADAASVTVYFRAFDNAGNVSAVGNTGALKVDTVAPSSATPNPVDGASFAKGAWKNGTCASAASSNKLCLSTGSDATSGLDTASTVTYTLARLSGPGGTVTHCWVGNKFNAGTSCSTNNMTWTSATQLQSSVIGVSDVEVNGVTSYYRWTVIGIKDLAGNTTPSQTFTFSVAG
jgi:hypothetical protein